MNSRYEHGENASRRNRVAWPLVHLRSSDAAMPSAPLKRAPNAPRRHCHETLAVRMHPAATMQPSAKKKTPVQNQASAIRRPESLAVAALILRRVVSRVTTRLASQA
jgi:hypothetical protein